MNHRLCLCVNCEQVVSTSRSCPLCGSNSLLNLSRVINREIIAHRRQERKEGAIYDETRSGKVLEMRKVGQAR